MKQIIKLLVVAFTLTACGPKNAELDYGPTCMMSFKESEQDASGSLKTNKELVKKKIIKDGKLEISVVDLKKSKITIDTLVQSLGGYYDNESLTNNDNSSEYQLKIRIPSNNLELLIAKIESGNSEVTSKEINARDVTEEFIDLETRLANKQRYLTRYQELLKSAKSVKEILDIQEKIRGLEEEIESTTGRLNYLNDLVSFSTLKLTITQAKEFKFKSLHRADFFEKLKQSLSSGWYSFVDFMFLLLSNWAIIILISTIFYFGNKYRKQRKTKKKNAELAKTPNA